VDEDGSPVPRKKSTSSLPAHIEAAMGAGTSSSSFAADAFGPFGHFRYSPPGQQPAIPIGIAGARIAEAEEPLDALAAQIQRIQQQSPVVEEGQQQLLQVRACLHLSPLHSIDYFDYFSQPSLHRRRLAASPHRLRSHLALACWSSNNNC
jgi:hypothetical protein